MKRALFMLGLGAALFLAGGWTAYQMRTASHRALLQSGSPELAWLQKEFGLRQAEFETIQRLHQAYLPDCARLCRQIDQRHEKIRELLVAHRAMGPEIETLLREAADLRLTCQSNMLRHFIAVSQAMPPEQGRRYLAWVQGKTIHMQHTPEDHVDMDSPHAHGH